MAAVFYCLGVCGSGFVAFTGLFLAAGFLCGLMPNLKNNLAVLARLVHLVFIRLGIVFAIYNECLVNHVKRVKISKIMMLLVWVCLGRQYLLVK